MEHCCVLQSGSGCAEVLLAKVLVDLQPANSQHTYNTSDCLAEINMAAASICQHTHTAGNEPASVSPSSSLSK